MDQITEYLNAGLASCRRGDYQDGIAFFDQALTINPTHLESLYNRAKAKYKMNAIEACLDDFNKAIAISPTNADFFSERAVVYYRLDNKKMALEDLTEAVEIDPKNPYRYASRAYIKDKYGDLEGAIADYNVAVELDPEDAISYNNKGLVEEKLGWKTASAASFKKADTLTGYKNSPPAEGVVQKSSTAPEKRNSDHVRSEPQERENGASRWQIVKQIFTSRDGRNDFIDYVLDLFKRRQ